jgi:hypothetical protein
MFLTYNAGVFRREGAPMIRINCIEIIYRGSEIAYAGVRGAGSSWNIA